MGPVWWPDFESTTRTSVTVPVRTVVSEQLAPSETLAWPLPLLNQMGLKVSGRPVCPGPGAGALVRNAAIWPSAVDDRTQSKSMTTPGPLVGKLPEAGATLRLVTLSAAGGPALAASGPAASDAARHTNPRMFRRFILGSLNPLYALGAWRARRPDGAKT